MPHSSGGGSHSGGSHSGSGFSSSSSSSGGSSAKHIKHTRETLNKSTVEKANR